MYIKNKESIIYALTPVFISTILGRALNVKVDCKLISALHFALSEELLSKVRINISQGISDELYEEKKQIN